MPSLDPLISTQAGDRSGVPGQTIKNRVLQGRLSGYRIGRRIMVPRETVEEYLRRARQSLELRDTSDSEAGELAAEGRSRC